jgi:hypothetical protein
MLVPPPMAAVVAPPVRRLTAVKDERSFGDVGKFAAARLVPADGKQLEVAEVYVGYVHWCDSERTRPLPAERFATPFKNICEQVGIATREKGRKVYCVGVGLAA